MIGQTISHYNVLEKLGEGGMGVVYKARDTKLDREVALKFLPAQLAGSDADRARFVQEARAAASLDHPNICTIFGIEEVEVGGSDGKQFFFAMAYVEGATLREKIPSLSAKQALDLAIQIADGLAAAHEKGIVHRDIKPENIMVRRDGIVQVMDFGLAKLRASGSRITRLTKAGSTVGTAGYMSPEQVQGQETDHRSDIFSYGVLLYEMLTGQTPFKGVHETALAYEIVNVDPAPMSAVRPELDPALDAIVLDCLEKDPKERCQSVAEVARDLRKIKRESTRQRHSRVTAARPAFAQSGVRPTPMDSTDDDVPGPGKRGPAGIWKWAAMSFLITTLAAVAWVWFGNRPQPAQTIRSFIPMPPNTYLSNDMGGGHVALSPAGDRIAFVAVDTTGTPSLWVRSLDALSAQKLSGTDGAAFPFWAPDGRTIAFFANNKLRKIDASGGTPFTICDGENPRSGSWSQSGVIVFSPRSGADGLYKVAAAGGEPVQITRIDTARNESTHRWPWFLPDGDHFVFFSRTSAAGSGSDADSLCIGSVSTGEVRRFAHGISDAAYVNGQLLYMRESALMAQPFDYEKAAFAGEPVPVAQEIQYDSRFSKAVFTVSRNGLLFYQTGASRWGRELALFDTSGTMTRSLGQPELYLRAAISSDEKRIAMEIVDLQAHNTDLWIHEIARGIQTRFTFDPHADFAPLWSPDDRSIVFSSNRTSHFDLYIKKTSGSGVEELLTDFGGADKYATDWSADGKYILFQMTGDSTLQTDIWVLPMTGDRKPVPFLKTPFRENGARFSPDMRWVSYVSDESGSPQVYVRPFEPPDAPGGGTASGKWQISTEPSRGARWRADGKAIIFGTTSNRTMVADVRSTGDDFEILGVRPYSNLRSKYQVSVIDLTSDGLTFLGWIPPSGEKSVPLTLVTNWDAELDHQ